MSQFVDQSANAELLGTNGKHAQSGSIITGRKTRQMT
jgi:hypothetical protein